MNSTITDAVTSLGGPAAAARKLKVTTQAVIFWCRGERKLPAEKAVLLEHLTKRRYRVEALRPDVQWDIVRGHQAA